MDSRLDKALEFSNYMTTLNNQKRLLWENYQQNLVYYFNGGKFSITTDLISFLEAVKYDSYVLIDDNNLPVKVDTRKFLLDIRIKHQKATTEYYEEYSKIKSKRKVEDLIA